MGAMILMGDSECESANTRLQAAVQEFYQTLAHFGHSVNFKIFEAVEGILVPDSQYNTAL
jgi:hypothetical protein